MQAYSAPYRMSSLLLGAIAAGMYGCAPPSDSPDWPIFDSATEPPPVSTIIDARPAALFDGRPIVWGELRPILNEAAGAVALEEVILDHLLEDAMARAGRSIEPDDVAAERRRLLKSIHSDPDISIRLLDELRRRQGLGTRRFDALMRRNAALRALVRDEVSVPETAVERLFDIAHGPRRQARLMVLPDLAAAQCAIRRVESGEFFGEVAVEVSTDSSAARGGLLQPISRSDPSYPEALRNVLWSLEPDNISSPVLIDEGYLVLMLVREIEGDGVELEAVRPELERVARLNQQRLLMDQLARRMLGNCSITVYDDALHESWTRRQRP